MCFDQLATPMPVAVMCYHGSSDTRTVQEQPDASLTAHTSYIASSSTAQSVASDLDLTGSFNDACSVCSARWYCTTAPTVTSEHLTFGLFPSAA